MFVCVYMKLAPTRPFIIVMHDLILRATEYRVNLELKNIKQQWSACQKSNAADQQQTEAH